MKWKSFLIAGVAAMTLGAPLFSGPAAIAEEGSAWSHGGATHSLPATDMPVIAEVNAMPSASRDLLRTSYGHVSAAQEKLLRLRASGSPAEIQGAEAELWQAEQLFIALLAKVSGLPEAEFAGMHMGNGRGDQVGASGHFSGGQRGDSRVNHVMPGVHDDPLMEIESLTMAPQGTAMPVVDHDAHHDLYPQGAARIRPGSYYGTDHRASGSGGTNTFGNHMAGGMGMH